MKNTTVKELIEDYRRRLKTVDDMLLTDKNSGSINDEKKFERLRTKAGEYRSIITDLENVSGPDEAILSALGQTHQSLKLMSESKAVKCLDEVFANNERILNEYIKG